MEFVDIAYSYLAPMVLLLLLFTKNNTKKYSRALLAAANTTLVFFFAYSCWQYYNLYRMAGIFGMNITVKGLLLMASTNKLYAAKMLLLLVFPLFFLIKKVAGGIAPTILMLLLLWWDVLYGLMNHEGYLLPISQYGDLPFQALRYLCLLVAVYALLWLLKRLPFQQR